LEDRLRILANKFKSVKFVKIRADAAIPNYPDKNLPTLLIYKKSDIVGQLVGLKALGGESVTAEDLEWRLSRLKIVDTEMTSDPKTKRRAGEDDDESETTKSTASSYLRRQEEPTYDIDN
jgi:hypothetical protein